MLCSECGRENAAGLDYCDYCGTPLTDSGPGLKRKTEMEHGGGAGGGGGKRKTQMEGGGGPSSRPVFDAAMSGEVEDPFDPFGDKGGGGGAAKVKIQSSAPPSMPPAPDHEPAKKRVTQFDSGDPFAPKAADESTDPRYAGRRIVGFLITFDRAPDGNCYFIREGRNLVGRDGDRCDIVIGEDDLVSGQHAVLVYRNGRLRVADDKSQNGTFLNDDDVLQPEEVADSDVIRVGGTRMICRLLDPEQLAKLWPSGGAGA